MKKIVFLGILSFSLAALWLLPLSFVKPYAEKYLKGLKMDNVSGTIWDGESEQFTVNKQFTGHVKWKVKALESITSLSLKSSFNIENNDIKAYGIASITPQKTLLLNNTHFEIDANYLNTLQKQATLTGDVTGNIKHAVLKEKVLPEIKGTIDWKEASVTSPLLKLSTGDYRAIISPKSGNLEILLSSSDAPADLNGKVILNQEWLFETNLTIKTADKGLAPMLGLLGEKQADGSVIVKKKGDLKPFIGK